MNKTSIEWTHRPETGEAAGGFTWNPIRARLIADASDECDCPCELCAPGNPHCGRKPCDAIKVGTFCTRISPGCTNCYASVINKRFGSGLEYTVPNLEKVEFFIDEKILEQPLKRKKPATIFVGDMFDLFHEQIPQEMVAEVFRVAWKLPRHTFQFLTKRAERMRRLVNAAQGHWQVEFGNWMWFGVSVESQPYADARIPELLQTRCAVRFLSVEPMLEAVDLDITNALGCGDSNHKEDGIGGGMCRGVDWVICGGESGPGARPFNLAWAESLQEQCKTTGVAFFMKQVGSFPLTTEGVALRVKSRGGNPSEWPTSLRVREFPTLPSQKVESVNR